jgi:hypothetical protein
MLTLRPTKMLARRMALSVGPSEGPAANPYADWSLHNFIFSRCRYLIVVNTRSLLPVVIPARGITNGPILVKAMMESIGDNLRLSGWGSLFERFILVETGTTKIAPIESRSLLGSINELVFFAKVELNAGVPADAAGFRLREIPMTYLGGTSADRIFPQMAVAESSPK